MKIALINTPYLEVYGRLNVGANHYFPLGLGYVAAVLREGGKEVSLLDPEAQGMDEEDLGEHLRKIAPQMVGLSAATSNFHVACRIADLVKEKTKATVVLGGVHASALGEEILTGFPQFDIIVQGEGEYTMLELCRAMAVKDDLDQVAGLVYRTGGGLRRTSPRPWIKEVDSLPFPARDLVDMDRYRFQVHVDKGKRSATLLSSRGCPARCTFCASHLTSGYAFRPHSPEYVLREIEHLVSRYGVEHVAFMDDNFTLNKRRAAEICRLLIEQKMKMDWFCFARVDTVGRKLLSLMREAGCSHLCFGVESASPEVLKNIKKGIKPAQARKALKTANELGYKTQAGFMFGNPGDTRKTIEETIDFAIELEPILASFNNLVPFPGTEVFDSYHRSNFRISQNWRDFAGKSINPVVESAALTRKDLQRAICRAYRRFYLRPRQLLRMLKSVGSLGELAAYIRGSWGLARQSISWWRGSRQERNDLAYWERPRKRRTPEHPVVRSFVVPKIRLLEKYANLTAEKKVLDVGCGNGFFTSYFSNCTLAVGLDYSSYMLSLNSAPLLAQGDACCLPFADGSFDIVFCSGLLHHLENPGEALREMKRASNDYVIILEPNRRNPLQFAFSLIAKEERRTLRRSLRDWLRLMAMENLKVEYASSLGFVFPNKTPSIALPLLKMLDGPSSWGISNLVIAKKDKI